MDQMGRRLTEVDMDAAAMRSELERLGAHLEKLHDGHAELQRKLREIRVSVTSADELVTVTVDARGQVDGITLDPRIYQRPDSRLLAATITAAIQQAAAEAMARVMELTRPFMPDETLRAHLDLDFDEVLRRRDAELLGG
jgi:DNA-binding protein YbaB